MPAHNYILRFQCKNTQINFYEIAGHQPNQPVQNCHTYQFPLNKLYNLTLKLCNRAPLDLVEFDTNLNFILTFQPQTT